MTVRFIRSLEFRPIRRNRISLGFVAWSPANTTTLAPATFTNTRLTRLGLKIIAACQTVRSRIARLARRSLTPSAGSGRAIGSGPCEVLPDHMDRWSRNQRLYETLKGMGLFVSPIPDARDMSRIDYIYVSVDAPSALLREQATETAEAAQDSVVAPVEGSQIGNVVTAAHPFGGGKVIEFPSKF